MSTPVQLVTITIDMSNVLEIRDERPDQFTLVIGPPDAADLLVIKDDDAFALRKWLEADDKAFVQAYLERYGVDLNAIRNREPPPTLEEPPF